MTLNVWMLEINVTQQTSSSCVSRRSTHATWSEVEAQQAHTKNAPNIMQMLKVQLSNVYSRLSKPTIYILFDSKPGQCLRGFPSVVDDVATATKDDPSTTETMNQLSRLTLVRPIQTLTKRKNEFAPNNCLTNLAPCLQQANITHSWTEQTSQHSNGEYTNMSMMYVDKIGGCI